MSDIADLIAEILDNPKLKNTAEKLRKEYRDEPILRTAAQMIKRLPQPLADAKKIALSPSKYNYDFEKLFYRQGMFLADFTDDCTERAEFSRYYSERHYRQTGYTEIHACENRRGSQTKGMGSCRSCTGKIFHRGT